MDHSSTASLKSFPCPLHSSESVCRFNKDPESKQVSYCVECVMDISKAERSNLLNVDQTLDIIIKGLNSQKGDIVLDTPPPQSLSSVIQQEDELLSKLSQHILSQKEKTCSVFKNIQNEINQQIETTRDRILQDLDSQFNFYKTAFAEYSKKLNKHFQSGGHGGTPQEEKVNHSKESILSQLNNCRNTTDLDMKVKNMMNEALNSQDEGEENDDPEHAILMRMKDHKEYLEQVLQDLPKLGITQNEEFNKEYEQVKENLTSLFQKTRKIEDSIAPYKYYKFKLNSKIISNSEVGSLTKLLGDLPNLKAKRINSQAALDVDLIKNWYDYANVLILVQSSKGSKYAVFRKGKVPQNQSGSAMLGEDLISIDLDNMKKYVCKSSIKFNRDLYIPNSNQNLSNNLNLHLSDYLILSTIMDRSISYFDEQKNYTSEMVLAHKQKNQFSCEQMELYQLSWDGARETEITFHKANDKLQQLFGVDDYVGQLLQQKAGMNANDSLILKNKTTALLQQYQGKISQLNNK